MNKQEAVKKACQIIRKRVRFRGASITLPGNPMSKNDAPTIREATRVYVESWIVPLLDAIESGNMTLVRRFYQTEEGDPIGHEPSESEIGSDKPRTSVPAPSIGPGTPTPNHNRHADHTPS